MIADNHKTFSRTSAAILFPLECAGRLGPRFGIFWLGHPPPKAVHLPASELAGCCSALETVGLPHVLRNHLGYGSGYRQVGCRLALDLEGH